MSSQYPISTLNRIAQESLPRYDLSPRSTATLINYTENATYRVDDPDSGERFIFRIYRLGYHDRPGIESEMQWMGALRRDAGVETPGVIPGKNGAPLQTLGDPPVPGPLFGAMFTFLTGSEPTEDNLPESFRRMGEVAGRMHRHSRTWVPPDDFRRPEWNFDTMLAGPRPVWGRWEEGVGLDSSSRLLLGRAVEVVSRRLGEFGRGKEHSGLVHADLRLANLLFDGDRTKVIDFDDCGFGWYLYDLSTALTFIEERPDVPDLIRAWLEGYRRVMTMTGDEEREIPTFLMLRRMMVMSWIASHADTELAQSEGVGYTLGTCRIAKRYLEGFS
ncbi:MAG: phosphotransferase enzyme family protein [Deltaproteobacteria bacterium]|nr:phosphotransferase [Candidatus Deferrimicrobiaceae bacterium]